jgi:CelD/BcsL family acetyltransferase involved in cellulose biosynthesis
MVFSMIRGAEAEEMLRDPRFQSQWAQLHEACPWATAYQSPGYVTAWHEAYRDWYSPFIVCEFSSVGDLIGLISLATENNSRQVTVAGAPHAEYETWLALPPNSSSFIEGALTHLKCETDIGALSFKYLSPGTPTDWIARSGKRPWTCGLQRYPRPIIPVGDADALTEYLRKKKSGKNIRVKWNRLKRLGTLCLERIREPSQLAPIFDQLITYYDLRQGGKRGKFGFREDLAKKPFHLALLKVPDLLHVTILKAGPEILSALFGIVGRKMYSLAMPMISPFHAAHSPMRVHLLKLLEAMHQEGYSIFDLTPSMDPFKERAAASYDSVRALSVYFRQPIKHRVVQASKALAIRALHSRGIEPHAALEHFRQFKRVPLRAWPSILTRNSIALLTRPWSERELIIYVLEAKNVLSLAGPPLMSRDRLADLLAFQPAGVWRTRQCFLGEALKRIEAGHHCYTRMENDRLLHSSWLIEDQRTNIFPETGKVFQFPPGSAVLYASYTDPGSRGCGLFCCALHQILYDVAQLPRINHIFTAVSAGNQPARHVIERVGFVSQSPSGNQRRTTATQRWQTPKPRLD